MGDRIVNVCYACGFVSTDDRTDDERRSDHDAVCSGPVEAVNLDALQRENAALQATIERCWKLAYRWHRESQRLPYYARMGELYADQLAAAINGGEKSGDE